MTPSQTASECSLAQAWAAQKRWTPGWRRFSPEGPSRLSPFFMPMFLGNMASGTVAIATGARGPNRARVGLRQRLTRSGRRQRSSGVGRPTS